ncbi:MAG TPA: YbaK/EbsC family protein [archaeon]|nr:YbaK/EbsC family protein [archaeon]
MLEDFIASNKLSAKVFATSNGVHSASRAQSLLGDADAIAKSILLMGSDSSPILVVLLGTDKVDFQKVKSVLNISDVRLATQAEVFQVTGYEIGGVPPISIYGVTTIVDKQLTKKDEVVCGGGDNLHLMRIKVSEIAEFAENVKIEDVRK